MLFEGEGGGREATHRKAEEKPRYGDVNGDTEVRQVRGKLASKTARRYLSPRCHRQTSAYARACTKNDKYSASISK